MRKWYNLIGLALNYSRCYFQASKQAPSFERHLTVQRTLSLLFANNNCFPTSDDKFLALFKFRSFFLALRGGGNTRLWCAVWCITSFFLKRLADFLSCITDHCNDAIVTTAMIPISVKYLCRSSKCRADLSHYLKRLPNGGEPIITVISNIGEDVQYGCFN
jgi:hypothetical protein